jgi:hypothetical protein
LLDRRETLYYQVLAGGQTAANAAVYQFLQHGSLAQLAQLVRSQAQILAYADATKAIALLSLVCIPLVLFMRKPRPHAAPVAIHT